MTEKSRFWESTSYTDDNFAEVLSRVVPDGVVSGVDNALVVAAGTGMQVTVATGEAFIRGTWYDNDASKALSISASDPSNPRIDRVVLRRSTSGNTITAAVLTGTPAGSPSAPSLTQDSSTWEISLAKVAVGAGVTSITGGNITDERTGCGDVPKNAVMFTTDSSAPSGFSEYTDARGRFIVGVPSGGDIGSSGTVGSALTNKQNKTHAHTGPSHVHTGPSHTHAQNMGTIDQYTGADTSASAYASSGSNAAMYHNTGAGSYYGQVKTGVVAGGTGDTGSSGTDSTGTASTGDSTPYIQLFAIKKS